jgi:hypothetical protein
MRYLLFPYIIGLVFQGVCAPAGNGNLSFFGPDNPADQYRSRTYLKNRSHPGIRRTAVYGADTRNPAGLSSGSDAGEFTGRSPVSAALPSGHGCRRNFDKHGQIAAILANSVKNLMQ